MTRVMQRWRAQGTECGAISAMVVVLILMLFAVAGLIYDGGRALNAREQAYDDAEQAARAGANQIDVEVFRSTGVIQIVEADARVAALDHLAGLPDRQYDNVSVSVNADQVTVAVERTVPTGLLQLVFVSDFTVEGQALAEPEIGILGGGS